MLTERGTVYTTKFDSWEKSIPLLMSEAGIENHLASIDRPILVTAPCCDERSLRIIGRLRNDADDAVHRVRSPYRGAGAANHFDPLNIFGTRFTAGIDERLLDVDRRTRHGSDESVDQERDQQQRDQSEQDAADKVIDHCAL